MIERKLFEKVDDNPGDYFGMLVEGYDSTYASVMKQADSDAQKLRDSWEKDGKSLFDTLSELGYESDYEDSPYMFKDADGGNTIVFDFRPINSFKDYATYFVVDKDNRIPDGWTKTKLMIDFWEDKNESLKEDSEYKTLAKLSNGLEVISYPYGYAVSDGYVADRFVVRDGKYIFDDGRFSLSDKDKEKILSLIKKGVIEKSLKESVSKSDLYSALEYMYGFNKKEANDWMKKASDKMKQSVVDAFKDNAKKSFLTDSLKESCSLSKDDISYLKNNKGKKLDKKKYKVEYNEYVNANTNKPLGGKFTLYKKAGKYGYDTYSFDDEDKLVNYINRQFCYDESLTEDKYFIVKSFYDGPHGFYGVIEDTSVIDNNGEYKKYRFNDREELKKFASELVSKGYKNQQGYTKDALLKEDKFVSRDKMSKKDKKELDSKKRNTWGNTNPVTRVQPNKKAYDRKRDKKVVEEDYDEDSYLNEFIAGCLEKAGIKEKPVGYGENLITILYDAKTGKEVNRLPHDELSYIAKGYMRGVPNGKERFINRLKNYSRKRDKKELAESTFENALKAKDGKIFMDTVGEKLIVLGNGMQHLSGNERIKFDDIVYYYKLLEDAYKAYGDYLKNSSSLKLRPWNYEDTTWNYPDEMYND